MVNNDEWCNIQPSLKALSSAMESLEHFENFEFQLGLFSSREKYNSLQKVQTKKLKKKKLTSKHSKIEKGKIKVLLKWIQTDTK